MFELKVKCPHCKKSMQFDATICPHCQTEATAGELAERAKKRKRELIGVSIIAGLIALGVVGLPNGNEPEQSQDQETAVAEGADIAAKATLTECYEKPNADCSKEEAAFEAARVKKDKDISETTKAMSEISARADCIKKELGANFDNAGNTEIAIARKNCGIIDPPDMEKQLQEQAERLSR